VLELQDCAVRLVVCPDLGHPPLGVLQGCPVPDRVDVWIAVREVPADGGQHTELQRRPGERLAGRRRRGPTGPRTSGTCGTEERRHHHERNERSTSGHVRGWTPRTPGAVPGLERTLGGAFL